MKTILKNLFNDLTEINNIGMFFTACAAYSLTFIICVDLGCNVIVAILIGIAASSIIWFLEEFIINKIKVESLTGKLIVLAIGIVIYFVTRYFTLKIYAYDINVDIIYNILFAVGYFTVCEVSAYISEKKKNKNN